MRTHPLLFLSVILSLSSCCIQTKIDDARSALAAIRSQQLQENQQVLAMVEKTVAKKASGKMDEIIEARVSRRLNTYKSGIDSVLNEINQLEKMFDDEEWFRKNYRTEILSGLERLKTISGAYGERNIRYRMVDDGINVANFRLFDLAAFFGSGKYKIPEDKETEAQQSFAPVVDSLILFSNKYQDIFRTASLVILGFADGTGFSSSGPLYDTLTTLLGKKEAAKEELNMKLSALRAEELIKQLNIVFEQKDKLFSGRQNLSFEYIGQGKGETLPLPTIKDYQVEDARRRIVLCYWIVLPH
jgi:hypothetical protein